MWNPKSSRKRYWEKKSSSLKNISKLGYGGMGHLDHPRWKRFMYVCMYCMCTYMSRQVPVHTCKIQTNNLKTFISCGKRKGKHILHVHVPGKFKIVKFTLYIHTLTYIHTYIHVHVCMWIFFSEGGLSDPSQTPYWMLVARIFYLKLGYRSWFFVIFLNRNGRLSSIHSRSSYAQI